MIAPDFSDRTYTAEVLKVRSGGADVVNTVCAMLEGVESEDYPDAEGSLVKVAHGFVASTRDYHRYPRTVVSTGGEQITVPRQRRVGRKDCNLYDALLAEQGQHVVVAVPFHDLAEDFFVQVHNGLSGRGTRYEKLNITALVMELGASGAKQWSVAGSGGALTLSVTRCHLAYADQQNRTSHLQQIRMSGTNLGLSEEYKAFVAPVLDSKRSMLTVTPTVLGFALLADGVRKSSATTDLHGNFKLWVAPGLRRLVRLFKLLQVLEAMSEVASTTANLPILQSRTIRDAEE